MNMRQITQAEMNGEVFSEELLAMTESQLEEARIEFENSLPEKYQSYGELLISTFEDIEILHYANKLGKLEFMNSFVSTFVNTRPVRIANGGTFIKPNHPKWNGKKTRK